MPGRPSAMAGGKVPAKGGAAVERFLAKLKATPARGASPGKPGRLLFAMDATASRKPSWDQACQIQGEMFLVTQDLGGLEVQLCYYRGFFEFEATPWLASSAELVRRMAGVDCRGGQTQIGRALRHAVDESKAGRVDAFVFVGDSFEEELDTVCRIAGEMGLRGLPAFMFHEGADQAAERAFREIARLSGGAYCAFDAASAGQLRELLSAVAVYAAGGRAALEDYGRKTGGLARRLSHRRS